MFSISIVPYHCLQLQNAWLGGCSGPGCSSIIISQDDEIPVEESACGVTADTDIPPKVAPALMDVAVPSIPNPDVALA